MELKERFLKYVAVDTQSDENSETFPSTAKQFDLLNMLKEEILRLKDRGATVIFSTHNMSSVEEICDNITLINRSKNILSGPVDAIRRSYGNDMYEVDFAGEASVAEDIISRGMVAGGAALSAEGGPGRHSFRFALGDGGDLRAVLREINERAELRGFKEVLPGMNDIFIAAVQGAAGAGSGRNAAVSAGNSEEERSVVRKGFRAWDAGADGNI